MNYNDHICDRYRSVLVDPRPLMNKKKRPTAAFGNELRRLRQEKRWSQEFRAFETGLARDTTVGLAHRRSDRKYQRVENEPSRSAIVEGLFSIAAAPAFSTVIRPKIQSRQK